MPRPVNADWAWRPDPWSTEVDLPDPVQNGCALGLAIRIFHDDAGADVTITQAPNPTEPELAAHAISIAFRRFGGGYLSVAIDLPAAATAGLRRSHILRIETVIDTVRPVTTYARANIRHGPNIETLLRELPGGADRSIAEFDLACSDLNERRVGAGWIDLIFEAPGANDIHVRDVILSRRPRAAF